MPVPPIFPPLSLDDDEMRRHVRVAHRRDVSVGDAGQTRKLHDSDHRFGHPGHIHENREQPGDRPLPPPRQDFPEGPRRDYYQIFGREETQSLPLPPEPDEPE